VLAPSVINVAFADDAAEEAKVEEPKEEKEEAKKD